MSAWMRVAYGLTAWLTLSALAIAQTPATPRKVYTNKPFFSVPLKIEEADRSKIASIKCYVKPPGGGWIVSDTGNAQTGRFNYNANEDGEYLFSFATVDPAGHESPANVEREPPRLVVVVDTKMPEFLIAPVTVASGQSFVQCTMKDANPDVSTVTAEAETTDGSFTPMLPVDANLPGVFRVPASGMPNRVRVAGKDRAGNAAVVVLPVNVATQNTASASRNEPRKETTLTALPIPQAAPAPAPIAPATPQLEPIAAPTPKNIGSGLILPGMSQPATLKPTSAATEMPKPGPATPRVAEKPAVADAPPVVTSADQLINSHRCVLNYAVDGINPASVEKVEAYATRDEGKTWQKLGEDPDRTSPIELQLPGDGRYGIVIVISATGRPGQAPVAGETADWWIEADTTAPEVTLESATPGVGDDAGTLILKWHVSDKNLKPDAVEFAWSNAPEGPWQTIAKGLRAEGLYRWPVPREAGSKAYLKIEAQDRAGNIGRAATAQPVSVEVNRPRAKVLGLNPAAMKQ